MRINYDIVLSSFQSKLNACFMLKNIGAPKVSVKVVLHKDILEQPVIEWAM